MTPSETHEQQQRCRSVIGHHGQQALDHREVGDGPADHLAGVQLVLAGAVQPGQRGEELGAQVVLDVQGEPAAAVAAQVEAAEVDRGRDDQQPGQRPDGLPGGSRSRCR